MTDILCRWLNEEVRLDPKLTNSSFAEQFSNGFLFGEVLHKHGLQDDFAHFSKGMSSEAKLNNFMRLEPTFRLLDIPFNINMAHDVMTERQGVATRLMYQLFVALNRKKQLQLTGQSLECMRPSGKVKLERIETGIFQERLKHQTPRQVDLNFEDLIQKFQERQRQHEQLVAKEKETEEERIQLERKEACHRALEKSQQVRERQTQMYAKLKPLSPGKPGGRNATPGKKATRAELLTVEREAARSRAVANETRESINAFEASIRARASLPTSLGDPHPLFTGIPQDKSQTTPLRMVVTANPSAEYVSQIKRRVEDDTTARKEREKRRRKVLVEQMEALRRKEEVRREMVLVERLMRQCQQERRIATQLMHIRKEKDTIRNNRILRHKQFEEYRLREFEEALNREAELARREEEEKRARLKHHLSLHRQYLSDRAKQHYQKNYRLCHQVILQLVDFATKMSEYREVTQGMVPAKIVRDWKTLFIAGRPLYEESDGGSEGGDVPSPVASSTASCPSQQPDSQQLLDDADLLEYRNVLCDWCPPESFPGQLPRPPNPILSHVVYHLLDLVDPPQPPPAPPSFPHFLLKASFVGKPFTGKSTSLQSLAEVAGVYVLSVDQLISKAVETFLSEKHTLEKQISSSLDAPIVPGESESPITPTVTPTITMQPSSSVAVVSSPGEVEGRGEGVKVEEDESSQVEGEEKAEPQEQKEGGSVEALMSQLSPLAVLGLKAHSSMVSGEGVEDAITIEIIAEELRSLPDGSAWVLESFPTTLEQAKTLASVLAGQAKPLPQLSREFVLLEEPKDREEELHAVSGLDLVVYFSASTEVVLQRASQQGGGSSPEDSKLDQVQHRVLSFDERWPELRRWYQQFRNLSTVNANQDLESLCSAVQQRIQEAINKAKQSAAMKRIGLPEDLRVQGSLINLSSISMTRIPRHGTFPSFPLRSSRPISAGSSSNKGRSTPKKTKKGATSPQGPKLETQESDVFILTASNVEPGSAEWQYCSLPLAEELARGLAGKWPGIETTYLRTLTGVFVMLRSERETICQYFYLRRNEIVRYLSRPDHKQEFVSQWQQNYNAIPTHLRSEDIMKAELHHRVDDLCDKLWDICDHRREEVEGERGRIVEDQWLDDHIGLLSNHYITLMQVELDKFQDTFLLLQDYYAGMEGKALDQLPRMGRIPLIELGVTAKQELPPSATSSMQNVEEEKEGGGGTTQAESPKRKIPLLPRQTPGEPAEEKGAKKKGGGPLSPPPAEDLSALELEHQLVVHAYNTAMATVTSLMSSGLKVLDSAIAEASKPPKAKTPPPQPSQPETKEEKGGKGGKGGKDAKKDKAKGKGSPAKGGKASPVKGGKGAAPPPEAPSESPTHKTPSLSPQEMAKKQRLLCMWREHKAAIQHEETTVKLRLQLIKTKALELIDDLKAKGKSMHEDIEQWIGQCYKQEVECVNNLVQVLRQAIENEEKLMYELELPGPAFQIQQSVLMFEPSPPPAPPSPFETTPPDQLTVHQLLSLHLQLMSIAPSGFMLAQHFTDTLLSISNKALGESVLPESWRGMTKEQVERLCEAMYGVEVDYVDWRRFVMCVAQSSSLPSSQQLVEAVQGFAAVGGVGGKVTREEYMGVETWVTMETTTEGFNRPQKLKEAFFEIFADPKTEQLNYKKMLLYFCMDPNPREGLFKALSVAVGEQVTSEQETSTQQIVLLEDFYQVLMHGVYSNTNDAQDSERAETSFISMDHLLKVFVRLNPGNPNEAPLGTLLSDPVVQEYLNLCSNYSLPDLSALVSPQSPHEHTEGE